MPLRVVTINILNDLSRWSERRELLVAGLAAFGPDFIGLQEVVNPRGASTAHELADALGGYSVHTCPKAGRGSVREGIAILSRLPVERHETLDLGSQRRVAQRVAVRVADRPVLFVNAHYYWPPPLHAARVRQVACMLDWLKPLPPETAVVACGDFNGTPDCRAIALMGRTLRSAYADRHGQEPAFTCPTPLVGAAPFRAAVTRGVLRLLAKQPGDVWKGTLDYIFVSPSVRVLECDVILDRPHPDDPGLYPSDHVGLGATLESYGESG
jgi:endonuclease/exonuclease/phosphatase family metal-dependent hydrolase